MMCVRAVLDAGLSVAGGGKMVENCLMRHPEPWTPRGVGVGNFVHATCYPLNLSDFVGTTCYFAMKVEASFEEGFNKSRCS